ncbi:hypothetical protein EYC98_11715 [Halieaceae bacterium IMCC14734]|uniref:TonB C-terminal domain-containing protein n=1 Tax=Candidatus Litorirhabdus singularis TaxID=2518993 RepID=A0ABT3TGW1_9GAMM|nr:hypothetical protein [Candidatus Litorirhabdus singularis]MCX2981528.1 hypothetical protein [Candidatus Litorirhabdus singularis]
MFPFPNLILAIPLLLAQAFAPAAQAYRGDADEPPTPYGLNYYDSALIAAPEMEQRLLRSAPEAQAFRMAAEQAELEGGAYGAGLGETLLAEAYYLADRGDYEGAIKGARRGLHVMRINEGLHDAGQMPVVKKLTEWYLLSGDTEAADDAWHYRNFLARRNWPAGSGPAIVEQAAYADWVLKLWLENTSELRKRVFHLYRELDEQRRAVLLERDPDVDNVLQLTYAQLGFLYAVSQAEFGPELDFANNYGRGYANDPLQDQLSSEDRQLKLLRDMGYQRGLALLQESLDWLARRPQPAADAQVQILLQLGDWHIWNDRHQRALEHYQRAWELSGPIGSNAMPPVELPSKPWFYRPDVSPRGSSGAVDVNVQLDIAANGRVTAADVANADVELPGANRLRRWLRGALYRPRLEAGKPVPLQGLQRSYRIQED